MTDSSQYHHAPKGGRSPFARKIALLAAAAVLVGLVIMPAIWLPPELALLVYTALLLIVAIVQLAVTIAERRGR